MARAYDAQEVVIAALQGFGDPDLAEHREDCATARRECHHGGADRRPFAQADGSHELSGQIGVLTSASTASTLI